MRELRCDLTYDSAAGDLQAARPATGCGACRAAGACAGGTLPPATVARLPAPAAPPGGGLHDGQRFEARLPARVFLQAVCIFPVLAGAMLAGAWVGSRLFPLGGDLPAVAGAAAALSMGCVALRLYDSGSGPRRWHRRLVIVPQGRDC